MAAVGSTIHISNPVSLQFFLSIYNSHVSTPTLPTLWPLPLPPWSGPILVQRRLTSSMTTYSPRCSWLRYAKLWAEWSIFFGLHNSAPHGIYVSRQNHARIGSNNFYTNQCSLSPDIISEHDGPHSFPRILRSLVSLPKGDIHNNVEQANDYYNGSATVLSHS